MCMKWRRKKKEDITFVDRLGFGILTLILVALTMPLLATASAFFIWVSFIPFFMLQNIPLILVSAFLLGFFLGDKYFFIIAEPFIRLFSWVIGLTSR